MKFFEEPKLEVEKFEAMDVITTSNPSGGDNITTPTEPEDWGAGDSDMFG